MSEPEVEVKEEVDSRSTDPMRMLDNQKTNSAAQDAEDLLNAMMMGNFGESAGAPPAKKTRIEKEEEPDEPMDGLSEDRNRVRVITIPTNSMNCIHEVALPPEVDYVPLQDRETDPAKDYPFPLDPFQKEAIRCIENNQSVLVSAHTSAGKTVVALYAIAQCLRDKQKVIYTSPIKALSNQKFRELEQEFHDVGLMTGDVTLNPDASCIVMTTEILRSMLYKGSEMMREVGYVVFDEIHYMRDKERGVVWEETIILLQHNVHHVFLSATIPNASQFAQWVAFLHNCPCHVVYTDYRPTPLQHFIFPAGGNGLYEVVNVKGEFRQDKFEQAMSGLQDTKDGKIVRRREGTSGDSNVVKIIRTVKERDMMPCIIFSFSRKECEAYARSLKDFDFTTAEEKETIHEVFTNAIQMLNDSDRKMEQITGLLPLLKRGIGVHHSGLLPIIKEVIEILFGESLIKALFATETFSMGLNMPARTVLFTAARKFDGKDNRWLTSGEYIQMSGRAGRRGLDTKGLVILMMDSKMTNEDAKHIIKGATDPLNSQFRLTYNMILNLTRVDGFHPEHIMERSFHQFQCQAKIPELYQKSAEMMRKISNFVVEQEIDMQMFCNLEEQIKIHEKTITRYIQSPKYLVPFLHAGRLLKIVAGTRNFGWGCLVNWSRKANPDNATELIYILQVLILIDGETAKGQNHTPSSVKPPSPVGKSIWEIIPMTLDCIDQISAIRVRLVENMESSTNKVAAGKMITKILAQVNGIPPLLDAKDDMKIPDAELKNAVDRKTEMVKRIENHPLKKRKDFEELKRKFETKKEMIAEKDAIQKEIAGIIKITKREELDNRLRVLRRLEYIDQSGVITKKGQVACEISACDELMLTEMLYNDAFTGLSAEHLVALLSCFVFQENAAATKMADELSGCLRTLHEYARRISKISNECKVEIIEEDYVASFKPGLMDVVNNWASGQTFKEVLDKTSVFEGSIIRCLRRLEEVLRELSSAAQAMSNQELQTKLELARTKIKRDIVFAASLYL